MGGWAVCTYVQTMHDRLMNFVFHKFVFVFGVLNTQYFDGE
jgi:hypothetical protein